MERDYQVELIRWSKSDSRSPLIVRGARQIGKSYLIEAFGKAFFKSMTVVNFEFQPELQSCFESLDPIKIVAALELMTNTRIRPKETLLFLDEIQQVPKAILALRYFKEKMPDLHVIAAGSLLEFVLRDADFSFPVGRVQFGYMHPLSFLEFLSATNQQVTRDALTQTSLANPLPDAIHNKIIQTVRQYFLVGGMPAAVNAFISDASYRSCSEVQTALIETFRRDFGKYASKAQHKYLQLFFDRGPLLVGQSFKYSHIDKEIKSRELKVALELLSEAGLFHRILSTAASGVPLHSQVNESRIKLHFIDIGLLQRRTQIDMRTVLEQDISQINAGALAEQFVGQELLAHGNPFEEKQLYFWEREKKGSASELDYVTNFGSTIVPIEVKSGKTGRLRSLRQFMEEKRIPLGVRISSDALELHNGILSVPFYLVGELERLVSEATS